MANNYDNIPDELKPLKQWVVWRLEERENAKGEMKKTKIPYKTQTAKAATTRKDEWMYFNAALEMLESTRKMSKWYDGCKLSEVGLNGLGFVFTDDDKYLGIDWDHIRDAETGEIEEQYVNEMIALNTYCEISQSGEGAHAICKGTLTGKRHRKANTPYEMYESERFFVMTGNHIKNTPTEIRESPKEAIKAIYDKIDPPKEVKKTAVRAETQRIDDTEILELCRSASNAEKFNSLYAGNVGDYGGDHSAADMALCSILAFYTQDKKQIERIFEGSGLVRDKWNREDYRDRTIENAISGLSETYTPKVDYVNPDQANKISISSLVDKIKKIDKPVELLDRMHVVDEFIEDHCKFMPIDELVVFINDTIKREFDIPSKKDLEGIIKKYKTKNKENKKLIQKMKKQQAKEIKANAIYEQWNGINIPIGYEIKDNKVCTVAYVDEERTLKPICNTPIVITKTGTNTDDKSFWVNVLFNDTFGSVYEQWITQKEAFTRNGIMELTNSGLVVTEGKASELNTYLSELLPINKGTLTKELVVSTNGWKKDDTVYVSGECGYTTDDKNEVVHVNPDSCKGLKPCGNIEDWYNGLKPLLKYDVVRFKMYAVLAAPLLKLLNQQSCIVDDARESSIGKTFSCSVGMSLIGNPSELVLNGDSTKTHSEIKATQYNDHALFIDELGTQNNEDALQALIYMIGNGQGRGRAKKDLTLQATNTWKTIALTTGEAPITSRTSFTGQLVRVIELKCKLPDGMGKEVEHGYKVINSNYGLIAPLYYENLFRNIEGLHGMFDKAKKNLSNVTDNASKRLSTTFACITVAGILLESVFCDNNIETCDPFKVVGNVFQESVVNSPLENYSLRALQTVMDHIRVHKSEFDIDGEEPPNRNKFSGFIQSDIIDMIPSAVKEVLKSEGFAPARVLDEWIEMKIIRVNPKRTDFVVNHGDGNHKYVRFNYTTVKELLHLNTPFTHYM